MVNSISESKFDQRNFTNQKIKPVSVEINEQVVHYTNLAKYLFMTLDSETAYEQKETNSILNFKKMYWLLERKSKLHLHNKWLLCKANSKTSLHLRDQLEDCQKKINVKLIKSKHFRRKCCKYYQCTIICMESHYSFHLKMTTVTEREH